MTIRRFFPNDVEIEDLPFGVFEERFEPPNSRDRIQMLSRRLRAKGLVKAIRGISQQNLHNFFTLLAPDLLEGPNLRNIYAEGALYTRSDLSYAETHDDYPWPLPQLNTDGHKVPDSLAGQTMAIVGDGPAGILMARLRTELGYDPESTLMFSPGGQPGGIWNKPPVVTEGHNTFRQAAVFDQVLRTDNGRPGSDLQTFLRGHVTASRFTLVRGKVEAVDWSAERGKYLVNSKSSRGTREDAVDSVLVCTGNAIPRALEGGPMETNINDHPEVLALARRWQQTYKPDSIVQEAGRRPLFIGLGNSTLGMLRQLFYSRHTFEPTVLTHYPHDAVTYPNSGFYHGGKIFMPLQRRPSDLTGLALDLPQLDMTYGFASAHWIHAGVRSWNILDYRPESREFLVEIRDQNTVRREWFDRLHILTGYQNDPVKMRALGLKVNEKTGEVAYDGVTHQAKTVFEGDPGRVYVAGTAARQKHRPNEEVIPGMMRTLPQIALTEIAAGYCSTLASPKN